MSRRNLLVLLVVFVSACASSPIVPLQETISKLTSAYIVPMEAPPLYTYPAGSLSTVPGFGGSIQTARGIGVLNTILIFMQMPEATQRGAEESGSIQAILSSESAWSPTIAVANEVSRQMAGRGVQAKVSPEMKLIPGLKDRSYTFSMHNWLAPLQDWYESIQPTTEYRTLASDPSFHVIEVGVMNFELYHKTGFRFRIGLKLIDASNGQVIGRATAMKLSDIPPPEEAFANNGAGFKAAFAEIARETVTKSLTELGLTR